MTNVKVRDNVKEIRGSFDIVEGTWFRMKDHGDPIWSYRFILKVGKNNYIVYDHKGEICKIDDSLETIKDFYFALYKEIEIITDMEYVVSKTKKIK